MEHDAIDLLAEPTEQSVRSSYSEGKSEVAEQRHTPLTTDAANITVNVEPLSRSEEEDSVKPERTESTPSYCLVFQRTVVGTYEQLSLAETFRCLNDEIVLDLDARFLDEPRLIHSTILAYRRRGNLIILNCSETISAFKRVPLHRDDKINVFVVQKAEDIKALQLSIEAFYSAQWGRQTDDATAFLKLCFATKDSTETQAYENAKFFREWAGPSSRAFALDDVITRFGFHPKRKSKFKALKVCAGLTHKREQPEQTVVDTSLEVQQKKLVRFLQNANFNPAPTLWTLGITELQQTYTSYANVTTDWSLVVAVIAAHQKSPKDPSTRFTKQCSTERDVKTLVSGFCKWAKSELEVALNDDATLTKAKLLLASVKEAHDD